MIYDLHNDLITGLPESEYEAYLNRARKQSVKGITLAFWTSRQKVYAGYFEKTARALDKSHCADIELAYAVEDLHFLDKCPLSVLSEIPLRYVGLTWNYDNALAGGVGGESDLTRLGREVLKEAERLHIAVDTAHLNYKSFRSVTDGSRGKVMNSHCCFNAVHPHPRNLSEEQIKTLIERGGIIGIALHGPFLSENAATSDDVVRHIDYFVQKFGYENLCIGTDFNGGIPPSDLNDYDGFRLLKVKLLKLGYPQSAIDGIFYRNAQTFFEK